MESTIIVGGGTSEWIHYLLHERTLWIELLLARSLKNSLGVAVVLVHSLLVLEVILILLITCGGELWINWLMIGHVHILELFSLFGIIAGSDVSGDLTLHGSFLLVGWVLSNL